MWSNFYGEKYICGIDCGATRFPELNSSILFIALDVPNRNRPKYADLAQAQTQRCAFFTGLHQYTLNKRKARTSLSTVYGLLRQCCAEGWTASVSFRPKLRERRCGSAPVSDPQSGPLQFWRCCRRLETRLPRIVLRPDPVVAARRQKWSKLPGQTSSVRHLAVVARGFGFEQRPDNAPVPVGDRPPGWRDRPQSDSGFAGSGALPVAATTGQCCCPPARIG